MDDAAPIMELEPTSSLSNSATMLHGARPGGTCVVSVPHTYVRTHGEVVFQHPHPPDLRIGCKRSVRHRLDERLQAVASVRPAQAPPQVQEMALRG